MRNLFTYLLISVFLFQAVEAAFIFAHFKINQDYIAKVLCINKEKPDLKCNGNCQLMKELKESEETNDNHHKVSFINKPLSFNISFSKIIIDYTPELVKNSISYRESIYSKPILNNVFHPPRACSIS